MDRFLSRAAVLLLGCAACAGCNRDASRPAAGDSVPPSAITDLAATGDSSGVVTLTWTAPGGNGPDGRAASYQLRCARETLDDAAWAQAALISSPPSPAPAGQPETARVPGLAAGEWQFAIKAADDAQNWSRLSNAASASVHDLRSPGAVADLAISSAIGHTITLTWKAPGDDGAAGRAAGYDLRYAGSEITEETWESATRVETVPPPRAGGEAESFTVPGLALQTETWFALRAADEASNWSVLSNVVHGSIPALQRLTTSSGDRSAGGPAWSPDGTRIAFQANWPGSWNLYVIPAAGGTRMRLTTSAGDHIGPSWSPDGGRIVFVSSAELPYTHELWTIPVTLGAQPIRFRRSDGRDLYGCAWSVRGRIAYVEYTIPLEGDSARFGIHAVPAGGGVPVSLWECDSLWCGAPSWSSDGTRIAFAAGNSETDGDLWIMQEDGSGLRRLTEGAPIDEDPSWSPDDARIVFASNRGGPWDLWTVPSEGGDAVRITDDPAEDSQPAWSPDGKAIAFRSDRGGAPDIWILYLE